MVTILLFLLLPWICRGQISISSGEIAGRIQERLDSDQLHVPIAGESLLAGTAVYRFYRERDFDPAWFNETGLNSPAKEMIRAIGLSRFEGLEPADYHEGAIRRQEEKLAAPSIPQAVLDRADLDILLTDAFLGLAGHLRFGRFGPEGFRGDQRQEAVILDALVQLQKNGRIFSILDGLRPDAARDYEALRRALGRYLRIKEKGGWAPVPQGYLLERGDFDDRVPLVRSRLERTGDLKPMPSAESEGPDIEFGKHLEAALLRFQGRHGLDRTGILDRQTLAAMNVPVEKRILQIRRNMDLRRHLPPDPGESYVVVNIPEMRLEAFRDGRATLFMRVIVGRPEQQTPVFSDAVTFLIINPFWYIPPEIVEKDILPGMRENPDYLETRGIRLFRKMSADRDEISPDSIDWQTLTPDRIDFYCRQDPGVHNSLGAVKFVMHNREHIYLHDTPSGRLFEKRDRALSSGCVRLENPLGLAAFMLADHPVWTRRKLREMMANGRQWKILLQHPMPVYLVYWTIRVDRSDQITFLPDIYHLENRFLQQAGKY